jgi:hypothetical protein
MRRLPKIFAKLLVVCYLATSSIAAVHAFPMIGNMGNADQVANDAMVITSEEASEVQPEEKMMACHQNPGASSDLSKESALCKISCSAISHVYLSHDVVELASIFHTPSPYNGPASLTTRQPAVDHQPPK